MITTKGATTYKFDLVKIMEKPAVYGDGCHVNYGETKSGYCTYGNKSSNKTIVLYGDSHAAQWFPALEKLATARGFKLVSLTKSACPAVDALRPDQGAFKIWFHSMLEQGVYLAPSQFETGFMSAAHSEADLDRTAAAARIAFAAVAAARR